MLPTKKSLELNQQLFSKVEDFYKTCTPGIEPRGIICNSADIRLIVAYLVPIGMRIKKFTYRGIKVYRSNDVMRGEFVLF